MGIVTLLFLAFLSCARTAQPHQADEDSAENFMEVPPNFLDSQLDESISSQPLSQEKGALSSFLKTLLHWRTSRSSFHFQPQSFRTRPPEVVGFNATDNILWISGLEEMNTAQYWVTAGFILEDGTPHRSFGAWQYLNALGEKNKPKRQITGLTNKYLASKMYNLKELMCIV